MGLVWITGARGFLGRHAAARFAEAGFRVAGVGLGGPTDAPIETLPLAMVAGTPAWIEAAISTEALDRLKAITGPPDVMVHAAGSGAVGPSFTDPLHDFRLAVETTAVVLDHLRRHAPRARFVLPSSAAIYGARPQGPIDEETQTAPVSPYGAHKVAAEAVCRGAHAAFGQPISIIRYFSLYGPTLRKQFLYDIGQRLRPDPSEIALSGTGEETRDLLHVEDAAALAFLVGTSPDAAGFLVVNGGTGRATTVRAAVGLLASALGRRTRLRFNGDVRPGDPHHLCAGTSHLAKLGFVPRRDVRDGISGYADWLKHEWATDEART